MSDLAALSSLAALWVTADEHQVLEGLADALLSVLRLDGLRVVPPPGDATAELLRVAPGAPAALEQALRDAFPSEGSSFGALVTLPLPGSWRGLYLGLGLEGGGRLLAVAGRTDFPTDSERLLLTVAVNQAAVAIQRAAAEQALRRQTEKLNRESERLRQLFQLAPSFMAVLRGPDHVYEMCNETYVRLAGDRDFIGRPIREVLPELERQGFCALLDRVYATGRPFVASAAPVDVERLSGGPAQRLYLDFIYQPIFDADGRVTGVFVQGHDVTEQTRAAEHRKLLINELNHRVKNTLATVQSLAHQTLRGAESVAVAKQALTARLLALSAAHDLLTRESWDGAEMGEIVAEAIRAFEATDRVRLQARGPQARLGPRAALAISMALQELATNAAKYGALSNDTGEVEIRWRVVDRDELEIEWRERGGPPVASPRRRGFGSRLLAGLSRELGGAAEVNFSPEGLSCLLRTSMAPARTDPEGIWADGQLRGATAADAAPRPLPMPT